MSWKYAEGNSHGLIRGDILRSEYFLQLPIFRCPQYVLVPEDDRKSFIVGKIIILYVLFLKFMDKI
jgi:hypothetical protein